MGDRDCLGREENEKEMLITGDDILSSFAFCECRSLPFCSGRLLYQIMEKFLDMYVPNEICSLQITIFHYYC